MKIIDQKIISAYAQLFYVTVMFIDADMIGGT